MTLSALIRKRDTGNLATAIPAISATQPKGEAATVARIATVAVANPKEEKTVSPAIGGAGDTAIVSRWWRVHFADGRVVQVTGDPMHNLSSVQASYPEAVQWEPFTPEVTAPDRPLTPDEAEAIRRYCLAEDCQPDEAANILSQCQRDADARDYFTGRAMLLKLKDLRGA